MTDPDTAPQGAFLAQMADDLRRLEAIADPPTSPHDGAAADVLDAVTSGVERRADELTALSHDLHEHPEVSFEERHAVAAVEALLKRDGHDAEVGIGGLETALRARAGSGEPSIAVLAEYDALPGIGHACGHNVICATAVGAFLAAADVVERIGGSVQLIGCPAEEGGGGKEYLARAGTFDEVGAAVMLHPAGFGTVAHRWLGRRQVEVTYHGRAAHASAMPFLGRNALDAVVDAYVGIGQLRQHLPPGDRVHGVITDGGQRPNIVPERATAIFYLRSPSLDGLTSVCERADAIFRGAALMTGTELELSWDPAPAYLPVRNNLTLARRYALTLAARGHVVLDAGVVPEELTGSTDLGNVSVRVPSIHPTLAISPHDVTIHQPRFAEWAASERADAAIVDGAIGLARVMVDFLADADLRAAVAAEFEDSGGVVDVETLTAPPESRTRGDAVEAVVSG